MTDLTLNPNPASVGERIYISGCGYEQEPVLIEVTDTDGDLAAKFYVGMFSTGCMDNAYFSLADAGTYTVSAYQGKGRKALYQKGAQKELKATAALTVS